MMKRKIRPPIYVHVVYSVRQACFGVGCHENEFFVHEQIDFQTGPMLGRIHDCHVDEPGRDLIDQILWHIDMDMKRDIGKGSTHPSNPVEQKGLSKTDFAADSQNGATAGRDSNLMKGALPQLDEHRSVAQKLFASRGERSAAFVPHEKRSA
ncbi:hypothetical protein MesoLj131a_68320 (plasmid) [Mesorhizobium sp. 131-2-1]|nr:hypothetical protein MesoLj131a_68320 [Mesorhizobium sp. 131-2-1]